MSSLNRYLNIQDLHKQARRRLPEPIYQYLESGSDDQYSLANNTAAFDSYQLKPRSLVDVSELDLRTKILGHEIDWPVFMAPTGFTGLFHPGAETAAALAAEAMSTYYTMSTFSNTPMETVAAATAAPKMFQVYVLTDKALNREIVDRAKAAKFQSMCLTVDTVVGGNREEVIRAGMTIPPKLTLKSAMQFALKPNWVLDYFTQPKLKLANLTSAPSMSDGGGAAFEKFMGGLLERKLTWDFAADMIAQWGGPFAVKGIMSAEDAKRAVDIGATAIMVSNHGGRQMDATPAPFELVAEIRDAVGSDIEVIVDGGIRRGTHVLKALAMGADACSIGRPYLYGLVTGGQEGAERALQILKSELERAMILCGCPKVSDIGPNLLRKVD